jgi:hypothetical protein
MAWILPWLVRTGVACLACLEIAPCDEPARRKPSPAEVEVVALDKISLLAGTFVVTMYISDSNTIFLVTTGAESGVGYFFLLLCQ